MQEARRIVSEALTIPTVHMNGTSRDNLVNPLREAYKALRIALDKLAETAPNGRDYYPQGPDAINRAMDEYRSRQERLQSVQKELTDIAMAVQKAPK